MKKQLIKHLVLSALLVAFLFISFRKTSFAPETENKIVVTTYCCLNGVRVGYSNDCTAGEGSCVDRGCNAGETEECNSNCTSF